MKLLLVFNPQAAGGRAVRYLPRVRSALEQFSDLQVLQTTVAGDAARLVADADLSSSDALVAMGGDGTLFEVLNGLYARPKEQRIPLGLIPAGTGNAFARDLGLQALDWEKAVGLIRAGRTRKMDVGRVVAPDGTYYFLNIVGAGLPVDAMATAKKLKFLGDSAYSLAALWCALKLKSYRLSIEIDDKNLEENSLFLEISNTRYTGASFLMAPDAVPDDGLLDVTLLDSLSRLRLLRLFPTIYKGRHVDYPEIRTFKAREIRITAPPGLALAPDGEVRGRTPATITCLRRDLRIICP